MKAPRHWTLCGEFTGTFPAQRASYAENVSIWWRHHDVCMRRLINLIERMVPHPPAKRCLSCLRMAGTLYQHQTTQTPIISGCGVSCLPVSYSLLLRPICPCRLRTFFTFRIEQFSLSIILWAPIPAVLKSVIMYPSVLHKLPHIWIVRETFAPKMNITKIGVVFFNYT